jgi:acyl-CoA thioester hydrolase
MVVSSVRVLYADTDQMGVANHAVALRWFEQARAEWLRRLGYTYREIEESGLMMPIYELGVRYHRPVRYDQLLALSARIELPGRVRVIFHYEVRDQASGELLVSGKTSHATINKSGRPRPIPDSLYALLAHGNDEPGAKAADDKPI